MARERERHCINLRLPGGEVRTGISPYDGAHQWATNYYPNLQTQTYAFKSISYGLPIPALIFKDEQEFESFIQQKSPEDQKKLRGMRGTQIKGAEVELEIQDYFLDALQVTEPKIIISNFHQMQFCRLFRDHQCHGPEVDQELDLVIVLGAYSRVVILEVKGSNNMI